METTLLKLQEECNFTETPKFIRHLHGGDINSVYLIEADKQLWVVKQNEAAKFPEMLEKEFRAMEFLHNKSSLYYPEMRQHFISGNQQFLVMEYVQEGESSAVAQQRLGKGLAEQHRIYNSAFGWEEDNYIGRLKQLNSYKENGHDFLAENRLLFQSKMAFDAGLLTSQDLKQMEKLCQRLHETIPEEQPALLHGDLWGGNYFISAQNKPVLYDPAIYFGHREIDIAMTKLFGGFSTEFYTAYQEENPLEKGWENRIPLFQLYPYLVHLNLFGSGYVGSVRSVLKRF